MADRYSKDSLLGWGTIEDKKQNRLIDLPSQSIFAPPTRISPVATTIGAPGVAVPDQQDEALKGKQAERAAIAKRMSDRLTPAQQTPPMVVPPPTAIARPEGSTGAALADIDGKETSRLSWNTGVTDPASEIARKEEYARRAAAGKAYADKIATDKAVRTQSSSRTIDPFIGVEVAPGLVKMRSPKERAELAKTAESRRQFDERMKRADRSLDLREKGSEADRQLRTEQALLRSEAAEIENEKREKRAKEVSQSKEQEKRSTIADAREKAERTAQTKLDAARKLADQGRTKEAEAATKEATKLQIANVNADIARKETARSYLRTQIDKTKLPVGENAKAIPSDLVKQWQNELDKLTFELDGPPGPGVGRMSSQSLYGRRDAMLSSLIPKPAAQPAAPVAPAVPQQPTTQPTTQPVGISPDAVGNRQFPATQPAKVSSKAEFDALPSGATYIGKDGTLYRKP